MEVPKGSLGTTLLSVFSEKRHIPIFFYHWKDVNEKLYRGIVDFNELHPNIHWEGVFRNYNYYLIDGTIWDEEYTDNRNSFSKMVWLSDEFLKMSKFKNPICAHWNPRLGKNQIHPGSSRMVIFSLFSKEKNIETFYFNTYNKQFDWIDNLVEVSQEALADLKENHDLDMHISADHGTFIPHLTFNGGQTGPMGKIYHDKIKKIVKERLFYIENGYDDLNILTQTNDKYKSDVILTIKKNNLSIQDKLRIGILIFLDYNWENEYFKIEMNG